MFDLRYHVASLTAVFLALVIGILVGVGIADRGLVDRAKTSGSSSPSPFTSPTGGRASAACSPTGAGSRRARAGS